VCLVLSASAGSSTAAWSSFLHDAQNTLSTPLKGPTSTPAIKWRTDLTNNAFASAALSSDGISYVTDGDFLAAYDSAGKKVWSDTSINFVSHPVLIEEQNVLLITSDRGLYVYDPKAGKSIRNITLADSNLIISGTSLVVDEKSNRAYFAVSDVQNQNSGFYAVDYSENSPNPIVWETPDMTTAFEYLGLTEDRQLLIASSVFCRRIGGSCDVTVQGLGAEDGHVEWFGAFPVTYHFSTSPVIVGDVVYLTASNVFALNATSGDTLWTANIDGASFSAAANGNLFTHSFYRGDLSIFDENGAVLKNVTLDGVKIFNAVVSTGSNAIYVVGRSGNDTQIAYVDSKTLETSWSFTVPNFVGAELIVTASNSLLLVGSELISIA